MVSDVQLLALATAVVWGIQPVFTRRGLAAGGNPIQVTVVATAVSAVLAWGAIAATVGVGATLSALPAFAIALFVVQGVVGNSLAWVTYNVGMERVGASIASAASNTYPLFAALFALALLFEPVRATEALGMVVIASGLVVLSLSKGGNVGGWEARDLALPVGAAVMWGLGTVIGRFGLTETPASSLDATALNMTGTLLAVGAYVAARDRGAIRDASRGSYGYLVVAGVLNVTGLLLMLEALDRGRVVLVTPLASTAPLFTTLFTRLLLGDLERVTRGIVVGTALVVAGVVVMSA